MDDPSRWIAKRGADHSPRGASSFRRLKSLAGRFTAEYGMIFVLLLLCALFSILTVSDQSPDGGTGAAQVAEEIEAQLGKSPRVLIVAGDLPEDAGFVPALVRQLKASGAQVLGEAQGKPQNAREALQKIAASGVKLDAIACTLSSGTWLVVTDAAKDFPQIGEPRIVTPRTYRWPTFLNVANLLNIANQIAIIAIIAIGMTMVIITGGIDLSVGSLIALSAVLTARFIRDFAGGVEATAAGMILASLAAILACGSLGAFSGFMITRFRLPPFIVTLAIMFVASGLAFKLAGGQTINQIPDSFIWLGRGADFFSLPNAVVLMFILYVLGHVIMSRMTMGRYLYAVGGNSEASRLSGIPVKRVLMFAYIASALLAGLGGVLMASLFTSGSGNFGEMYELYVIAAVVVGGTSLSGGKGKMFGTLIGAFTIAVIQNGMNLKNVDFFAQKIVLGMVLLAAVLLDKIRRAR